VPVTTASAFEMVKSFPLDDQMAATTYLVWHSNRF